MVFTVQFIDMFAHLELFQHHNRLRKIFESLLNTVTPNIYLSEHDQVRFVLHPPQLFMTVLEAKTVVYSIHLYNILLIK